MKKTMMILLALALVMGSVFAADTINLTSTLSIGDGTSTSTGAAVPTFTCKVFNGANEVTATAGAYAFVADTKNTATVKIYQNNKVNFGGAYNYYITVAVSQSWKGNIGASAAVNENEITIDNLVAKATPEFSLTPDAAKVGVTAAAKKFTIAYPIGVFTATPDALIEIGSFDASWQTKPLIVDTYSATLTVTYSAT